MKTPNPTYYDATKVSERDAYFAKFSANDGITDKMLAIIGGFLETSDAPQLLDLGTGNGFVIRQLLQREPAASNTRFIGIDTSAAMLASATASGVPNNVVFQEMDNAALDFEDASFDIVTAKAVTHISVSEAYRVLKPGGWLIYKEYGPGKGLVELMALFNSQVAAHQGDELMQTMQRVGFTSVTLEKYFIPVPRSLDDTLQTIATMRVLPAGVTKLAAQKAIRKYYGETTCLNIHSDPFLIIAQK